MSTNTSQNLGLHLWEPTDQVLRTEFNQNWTKLDTAVNTAQETAEAAQDTADAAYCPTNKPFVAGSYVGANSTQSITLGFKPSLVIIYGGELTTPSGVDSLAGYLFISNGSSLTDAVSFTDTGFTIHKLSDSTFPRLLECRTYAYIAFR